LFIDDNEKLNKNNKDKKQKPNIVTASDNLSNDYNIENIEEKPQKIKIIKEEPVKTSQIIDYPSSESVSPDDY
jgi:fructose-1,6-bisphosphatase/inositol monophosphatase family enzyme